MQGRGLQDTNDGQMIARLKEVIASHENIELSLQKQNQRLTEEITKLKQFCGNSCYF